MDGPKGRRIVETGSGPVKRPAAAFAIVARAMPEITFASSIQRHVACPPLRVGGATVREALDAAFDRYDRLRGYVVDDQGHLRHHVAVFVDGRHIGDPRGLSDPVGADAEIHVIQALSGG